MIELELLHEQSLIGITMYLPRTKILLIYHTHAILVSEPFCVDSSIFHDVNVLYVDKADSFEALLEKRIVKCRLVTDCQVEVGMCAIEALEALQK